MTIAAPALQQQEEEFDAVGKQLAALGFGVYWSALLEVLNLPQVPGMMLAVMENGQAAFDIVEDWTGEPYGQIASSVASQIQHRSFATLASTSVQTRQGGVGGGFVVANPLRAALSLRRSSAEERVAAPLLAIALIDAQTSPESPNGRNIGTAVNNQRSEAWARTFGYLPVLENQPPFDYLEALESSCARAILEEQLRQTDHSFLRSVGKGAADAASRLRHASQKRRTEILTRELILDSDDDENEPSLIRHTAHWQAAPTDALNAGEPEVNLYQDEFLPFDPTAQDDDSRAATASRKQIRAAFRSRVVNQHSEFHWRSLSPPEVGFLISTAAASFKSADRREQALGMLVLLSVIMGKTPEEAGGVLTAKPLAGEGICAKSKCYRRQIPHPPQGWRPREDNQSLKTVADMIELALPTELVSILGEHLEESAPPRPIWSVAWKTAREFAAEMSSWINRSKGPYRLTPRRLANILPNLVFAKSGRHAVIYWLFLRPDDPPPSGVYYTAYATASLRKLHFEAWSELFKPAGLSIAASHPSASNLLVGSRLQIPIGEIRGLSRFLQKKVAPYIGKRSSLARSHNTFVAYVITLLNFSTGHRPVTDPFDARYTFSVDEGYVVIDDKNLDAERSARLVPLAPTAIQQMKIYDIHLRQLAAQLTTKLPKLAATLRAQFSHPKGRILPAFFFIGEEDDWIPVQPCTLASYFPPDWQYPPNAHRHVIASSLSLKKVAEYAINQFLGHVDAGTASLSGLSRYAPKDIFDGLRPVLESVLESFNFYALDSPLAPQADLRLIQTEASLIEPAKFGCERRAEMREQSNARERQHVQNIVAAFLGNRSASQAITNAEIRDLINLVEARSIKVDFRHDQVRMNALREELNALKQKTKDRFFIPGTRLVLNQEFGYFHDRALFDASLAKNLKQEFADLLEKSKAPIDKRGGRPDQRRFAHALLSLIVNARLSDAQSIKHFILEGEFLVHRGEGNAIHLQYFVNRKNVRRIPLDEVTARLLHPVPRGFADVKTVEAEIRSILSLLSGSYIGRGRKSTIDQLCQLVDARNRLDLPGQLADYLSGASQSAVLPFSDWLRIVHGRFDSKSKEKQRAAASAEPKLSHVEVKTLPSAVSSRESAADEFINAITKTLSHGATKISFDESAKKGRATKSFPTPEKVQKLEQAVQQLERYGKLSPLGAMAASWIAHLMKHGGSEGRVVLATVRRYWAELKRDVIPLGYMLTADEISAGALEQIYHQSIDVTEQHQEYVRKVLGMFHAHIEATFGIQPIDWSEVIPESYVSDSEVINPSFLTEHMYFHVLQLLLTDLHVQNLRERQAAALLVVLMYRFGLRTSEARGLLLRDVFRYDGRYYLRVAPNFARKIKTDAGIRFVPALEPLNSQEADLVARFHEAGLALHSNDALAALFASELGARDLSAMTRICARAADAIMSVAASPNYSLYCLRHSFVTRIHENISHVKSPMGVTLGVTSGTHGEHANRLLAIVTGHVRPSTTIKHYAHRFDQLLDEIQSNRDVSTEAKSGAGCMPQNANLDSNRLPWQSIDKYPECELPTSLPPPRIKPSNSVGTIETAVRLLQFMSYGHQVSTLPGLLKSSEEHVANLLRAIQFLDEERAINVLPETWAVDATDESRAGSSRQKFWLELSKAASKLDAAKTDPEIADKLCQLALSWFRHVVSIQAEALLNPIEDLTSLRALLDLVEIDTRFVLISLSEQDKDCTWYDQAISSAAQAGLVAQQVNRLARPASQVGRKRAWARCAVSVRRLDNGMIRNSRQLGFLLLAIWLAEQSAL